MSTDSRTHSARRPLSRRTILRGAAGALLISGAGLVSAATASASTPYIGNNVAWCSVPLYMGRSMYSITHAYDNLSASTYLALYRTGVGNVQRALNRAGYRVGVDNVFGPATRDAVIRFQRSRHLVADGVVGERTLNALPGCGYLPNVW